VLGSKILTADCFTQELIKGISRRIAKSHSCTRIKVFAVSTNFYIYPLHL